MWAILRLSEFATPAKIQEQVCTKIDFWRHWFRYLRQFLMLSCSYIIQGTHVSKCLPLLRNPCQFASIIHSFQHLRRDLTEGHFDAVSLLHFDSLSHSLSLFDLKRPSGPELRNVLLFSRSTILLQRIHQNATLLGCHRITAPYNLVQVTIDCPNSQYHFIVNFVTYKAQQIPNNRLF